MTLTTIWKALQAGKMIDKPAKWKNIQNTTNALVALLSLMVIGLKFAGIELPLTDEQIVEIAGSIAVILGIANQVVTTITTKKVSITGKIEEDKE